MQTISELRQQLLSRTTTCRNVVSEYLVKIEKNKHLNAYLEVYSEEALKRADEIDNKISEGKGGKLAGVVIGLKDNICYKNHRISAASKILEGFVSVYSATVTEKLLAEDAIIIGRLNCDEFAFGSSNEKSAYGPVLNPLDHKKVPGGSSGGSAAAVAAGLCHAALGSDTGGSVRQPAAFCGVVGFKPTYGRVSRYGLIAYASSFDQIGPLTNSVEDCALIMEVISGKDGKDATASSKTVPAYTASLKEKNKDKKWKIAYLEDCFSEKGLDPEIKKKGEAAISFLQKAGHTVDPVSFPYLDYMVPAYYVLTTAEASSNLSRFGGILYGHRSKTATDIDSTFRKSRSEGFGEEAKRRIMLGTFVLSAGYYDAYYAKGQKVRRILQDKTNVILKKYDFIFLPTTPKTAFEIGGISDPVEMYLQDIFTVLANLTGHPAIAFPGGIHTNGLPFSFQLIGNKFEEGPLFELTHYLIENQKNIK